MAQNGGQKLQRPVLERETGDGRQKGPYTRPRWSAREIHHAFEMCHSSQVFVQVIPVPQIRERERIEDILEAKVAWLPINSHAVTA